MFYEYIGGKTSLFTLITVSDFALLCIMYIIVYWKRVEDIPLPCWVVRGTAVQDASVCRAWFVDYIRQLRQSLNVGPPEQPLDVTECAINTASRNNK